jgi:hypothetical protein
VACRQRPKSRRKKSPALGGDGVKRGEGWPIPPPLSIGPADAPSNRRKHLISFNSADCCARERCVAAISGFRVAPAHDKPHSGQNNSERESTSGRSTDYGSGHLIRVFRDIGRTFSLLFLLSHPLPIGHQLRGRVQNGTRNMVSSKAKMVSFVFRGELRNTGNRAATRALTEQKPARRKRVPSQVSD